MLGQVSVSKCVKNVKDLHLATEILTFNNLYFIHSVSLTQGCLSFQIATKAQCVETILNKIAKNSARPVYD